MRLRLFFGYFAALGLLGLSQTHAAIVGEIPFQYRDGFLWLKVLVDGQTEPLNFLLDSGAASSVMDAAAARRLDMRRGERVTVQGVHSRTTAWRIDKFKARAAGIALPESVLAVDLNAISKTCHQRIDGLLGADFFENRIVQIDFVAGKIRLLDRVKPNGNCAVLPMRARNGTFCVPVDIAGNRSQWMRVDTGCDSALEWVPGRQGGRPLSGTSIGLTSAHAGSMLTDVQLGDRTLQEVKTGIHERRMFPGESGLVGSALLSRFRVTFDALGGRLLLESR